MRPIGLSDWGPKNERAVPTGPLTSRELEERKLEGGEWDWSSSTEVLPDLRNRDPCGPETLGTKSRIAEGPGEAQLPPALLRKAVTSQLVWRSVQGEWGMESPQAPPVP